MKDYKKILQKQPAGVLATQEGDKVKTRVFQYMFIENDKVYFCTNAEKAAYEQLQKNPYLSFCTFTPDFSPVLSINGKAIFIEDIKMKKRALEANGLVESIYKSADNPIFKVFYIDAEEVVSFDMQAGAKVEKL